MTRPRIIIQKYDSLLTHTDEEKSGKIVGDFSHFVQSGNDKGNTAKFDKYIGYYISAMLTSALLMAFYVVQVFTHHSPCAVQSGKNITESYELAFQLGLFVHVLDGFNTSCVNVHYRFRIHQEETYYGEAGKVSAHGVLISTYFEWLSRAGIIGISIFQLMIIHSQQGKNCEQNLLAPESEWLASLIQVQVVRVVVFAIWKIALVNNTESNPKQRLTSCSSGHSDNKSDNNGPPPGYGSSEIEPTKKQHKRQASSLVRFDSCGVPMKKRSQDFDLEKELLSDLNEPDSKPATARHHHKTLVETPREGFGDLSAKIISKLKTPLLVKLNTVPTQVPVTLALPSSPENFDVSSNKSWQPPQSYYQGYQKMKKSKTDRKLVKKNTKTIKVSILESNPNALIDKQNHSQSPSNRSQNSFVRSETFNQLMGMNRQFTMDGQNSVQSMDRAANVFSFANSMQGSIPMRKR